MNNDSFQKGIKYEISFMDILSEICEKRQISFTLLKQFGGYTHNKGYTTETSLRVVIIGIHEDELTLLGKKLKEIINTDTIMITKTDIEYSYM